MIDRWDKLSSKEAELLGVDATTTSVLQTCVDEATDLQDNCWQVMANHDLALLEKLRGPQMDAACVALLRWPLADP